ncbi:MAG: hypothetical protein ACRC9Q_09090 [Bacteroidales bacterium]
MRNRLSHIILVVSLIAIWFMGSVGGNAWHAVSSHFCSDSFAFTTGHHLSEACHSSCCGSTYGTTHLKASSCDDCTTCTSTARGESCFCKEADNIESELVRMTKFIVSFEQIKLLCIEIFNTEQSTFRQWHIPPLLCFSSRHLLSLFAVLII